MRQLAVLCAAVLVGCVTDVPVGQVKSCKQELSTRPCNATGAPAAVDWGSCGDDGLCTCIAGGELTAEGRCKPATACDASICANPTPSCTPGRHQDCNEDLAMSALAGACGDDGRCTCTAAFETGPAGRCRPQGALCREPDAGPTLRDGGAPLPPTGSCEGLACAFGDHCEVDDAGVPGCTGALPEAGCFAPPTCGALSCGAGCTCVGGADAGWCNCPPPDRCTPGQDQTCNDEVQMSAFAGACARPDGGQALCGCLDGFVLNPATARCRLRFIDRTFDPATGSLAVAPGNGKVGVAWIASNASGSLDVRYLEVLGDTLSSARTVDTVHHDLGVALAFDPAGEPKVGYLGGPDAGHVFWQNTDAVVASRAGGNFTVRTLATSGADVTCGNPVSDRGLVVGVNMALAVSGGTTFAAWRDVHDAQFPNQDFNGSDVEAAVDTGAGVTLQCVQAGGNDKGAWGAHARMALSGGQPALVYDQLFGMVSGTGQNVVFTRRQGTGAWTAPQVLAMGPVEGGPSLVTDAPSGFLVAAQDQAGVVRVYSSADGQTWGSPSVVTSDGVTGGGADLAVHPVSRLPQVVVATSSGLRLYRADGLGGWTAELVTAADARRPRVAMQPDGRRVVAWVDAGGALRLSIER